MTTTPDDPVRPLRRALFNRYTVLAFIAGAAVAIGVGISARAAGMAACHHGSMLDGTHSAADVNAHVDHLLKHFYVEIDATDEQKAKIGPLVHQAVSDILPLHSQLRAAHTQAMQALTQATLDRNALESVRQQHIQLADQASKRLVQLIGDVGELLTPAQREAFAAHVEKMRAMPAT
jgi:Spy/CpxP family protein refolding chaperone